MYTDYIDQPDGYSSQFNPEREALLDHITQLYGGDTDYRDMASLEDWDNERLRKHIRYLTELPPDEKEVAFRTEKLTSSNAPPVKAQRLVGASVPEARDPNVRGGYTKVPNEIFDYAHLSMGEKMLYMALWRYCWQDNHFAVGFEVLARDLSVTGRSIENYLYGMPTKPGLIYKTPRPNVPADQTHQPLVQVERTSNKTNIYTLPYKPVAIPESSGGRSNVTSFRKNRR